jgi:hypothetical protein
VVVYGFFGAWIGSYWPVYSDPVIYFKGGLHGPVWPSVYGLLLRPFGDVVEGPVHAESALRGAPANRP